MNTKCLLTKFIVLGLILTCALQFGCGGNSDGKVENNTSNGTLSSDKFDDDYTLYQKVYFDLFDTFIMLRIFAKNETEFNMYDSLISRELERLHKLFDIYNDYEGLNNIKTVNDNAGLEPVPVDPALIDLVQLAMEAYEISGGTVNIALGSVLRIWHEFRHGANEGAAVLPSKEELNAAGRHTYIKNVELNKDDGTIFLRDAAMSLDLGALGKGYAVELAKELAVQAGMVSGIINAGGDVSAAGSPLDGRNAWRVGIQNPSGVDSDLLGSVDIADMAVATSGDYHRYYTVDGENYHHIIDPATFMPARQFRSVTVLHSNLGIADLLSTALFILPVEEGKVLLQAYDGEAMWILQDNSVQMTEGYRIRANLQ